jgi:hypothetical protein
MMLDYAQLAALAAVVGEGSFERAARVLHVTPSAVSQRIRQLEERVGAVLVQRGAPCRAAPRRPVGHCCGMRSASRCSRPIWMQRCPVCAVRAALLHRARRCGWRSTPIRWPLG